MNCPRLVITSGEPAGIGPDICLKLFSEPPTGGSELVILGSGALFQQRASSLGIHWNPRIYRADSTAQPNSISFLDLDAAIESDHMSWVDHPGTPKVDQTPLVMLQLDRAVEGCLSGDFAAMVTAPVQKSILCEAGHNFSGHTEYLQEKTYSDQVVMLLATLDQSQAEPPIPGMKVALVTTHLPLRAVPDAVTKTAVQKVARVLYKGLRQDFGIEKPRILVLGLNPHAGEQGHLGTEEQQVIEPALNDLRKEGIDCLGPASADTAFTPESLKQADAILAMYHDQGLTVLKHQGFGISANITLGMPIIRTSVDHGTALDLAGSGEASDAGLRTAIHFAEHIVRHRMQANTSQ